MSFLALGLDSFDDKMLKEKSGRTISVGKNFSSYLFPWLIFISAFAVINLVFLGLWPPLFGSAETIGGELQLIVWAVIGLFSGIVADRFGRKPPIMIGLGLLGVSFAILGLVTTPLGVLVYYIFYGASWGFILTVYLAVLGDLASPGSKEKIYALGLIVPVCVGLIFGAILGDVGPSAPASPLSLVLSIILFAAIFPILRASETLPEEKIRSRQMKEHMNKVGELVEEFKKTTG
jgi:MFS family permease